MRAGNIIIAGVIIGLTAAVLLWMSLGPTFANVFNVIKANHLIQKNYAHTPEWQSATRVATLNAVYSSDHLLVPVTINGVDGFKFLLSTEHSHFSLVDTDKVKALNLEPEFSTKSPEIFQGNVKQKGVTQEVDIRIGPLNFPKQTVAIIYGKDYWTLLSEKEKRYDGIIGMQFFKNAVVSVNPATREIHIAQSIFDVDMTDFQKHQVRLDHYGDVINFPVVVKQEGFADYWTYFMWSSMSNYVPCMLNTKNNIRIQKPSNMLYHSPILGHSREIGRIEALVMGHNTLASPVCGYMNNAVYNNTGGIIGSEIINRFHVIYDLRKENIYLKPGKSINDAFGFDRTGFTANRMSDKQYIIHFVEQDTPAHRAGLTSGDIITALNDQRVTGLTDEQYKTLIYFSERLKVTTHTKQSFELVLTPRI